MKTRRIQEDLTRQQTHKRWNLKLAFSLCLRRGQAIARHMLIVGLVLMPLIGTTVAQSSCEFEEVKVGFQGKTCAFWDYAITLNGVVASGYGTQCISIAIAPNFTNKAWTTLKVDKIYQVSAGSGLCITNINFDIPPDYVLYIDGVESNTIYKTSGGFIFSGDGTWEVVVHKKCKRDKGGPGDATPWLRSVVWEANMGNLTDGRSAEHISIREKALTPGIYTPAALVYSPPPKTSEVDVVSNGDGGLRQVKAPQALADVVVVNPSEYDIRYYRPADVGAKVSGIYTVTGQPYVTWKIKNPDPSTTTKLQILKIEGGVTTDKSEYVWDPPVDSWSLSTGWSPATGIYARTETKQISYPTQLSRTETFTVKESNGQVVSKSAKTYLSYPWGEELVQEVLDPDAAALTTTYTYYETPSETHRYRKVKTITYPDGSWEKYDYDIYWNISKITRPWKDLSLASATDANSDVTLYGYINSENGVFGISEFPRIRFDVEEQINGVTVRKTRFNRSIASQSPELLISEAEASYSGADNGWPVNLISQTITTRYHHSASQFLANRIASVVHPDGRQETYSYEKGNYVPNADPSLSQFVPDVNGLAERDTVVYGTTSAPEGINLKTTKEVTVRAPGGNQVLQETYVYNGGNYERISWTVMDYDDRGHVLTSRNHKGEVVTATWNGEQKTSDIDATGIETTYTYDSLNRIKTQTKKGIAAGGGFPAQPDIVRTFSYDAEGHQTNENITGSSLSLTSSRAFDKAGRLKQETDQAGLSTTYNYANGGRTTNVSKPGGATEMTERYLDGDAKSVTGTAVVARYFDKGVNPDGTKWRQDFVGSAGLSSPRWTRTTTDWIDRIVSVEKPSFSGTTVVLTSLYNSLGQLQKQTTTSGSTRLIADKLYEYDQLGEETRRGLDIDADGVLTLLSTDRISESEMLFEKTGVDWFRVTSDTNYLSDNNSTPTVEVKRERLNNFALNGTEQTVSDVTVTDLAGSNTRTTIVTERAAKKQSTITDTPDSNINAVLISVNGFLQSSTATTPQSATTYTFDSLGRQTSVTDPRTGITTRSYNPATGEVASTDDGAGTTSYEYYPATHLNAGRLKTQIDPAGKKTYFSYNGRGDVVQMWGDATYPVEYVYDTYGQRTELHTFRAGQNWSAVVWPASTTGPADVTRWIYQDSTGLLTQKQDAALKGTSYTYDEQSRLKTRVWARGITCTYGYDLNTGELRTMTYSDNTPPVSFAYDRGGRPINISDAAGAHTRTYTVAGDLLTEQISTGILDGLGVSVGYDSFLRRNSVQTTSGATIFSSQSYGYDATSRLETITSGSQSVTYSYHPNSGLLSTTAFTGGTSNTRSYDSQGRLQSITNTPAADTAQSFTYSYNNLNQRTRTTREDGSYWSYLYNDRGELISGKKFWSDNSPVWGLQTEYNFDNIGNRNYAKNGGNQLGNLRQSNYTTNSLNQYTQRSVPGAVDITGTGKTAATVTVNNQATARKGEYFYKELAADNSTAPVYAQVNVVGARNNFGAGGEDAVTQKGGHVFVPRAAEVFTYDDDGNITSDGQWSYTWDGENQLISMEAIASVPDDAKQKLEFAYDQAGRRIQKKAYHWNVGTASYQLVGATRFVYDHWNVVAEIDSGNAVVRSYTWGQDLSGTLQGAGGIGGLLLINGGGNTYQVGYNGNGSVAAVINAATGKLSAVYDYDPFGNTVQQTGEFANENPFRFSGKYTDAESGLIYYGYRYYNPRTGRWISRDPSGESGGANLYGFVGNDPGGKIDARGLYEIDVHYFLTFFLAAKSQCLLHSEANQIANADQGTDENPETMPGPGSISEALALHDDWVNGGKKGMRQAWQNAVYHGLHPNGSEFLETLRMNAFLGCKGDLTAFGAYLHHLQDSFSHAGYTNPIYGHLFSPLHWTDKTHNDVGKAEAMVRATWSAINNFTRAKRCCDTPFDQSWWPGIRQFLEASGGPFTREINDEEIKNKRDILGLEPRWYRKFWVVTPIF